MLDPEPGNEPETKQRQIPVLLWASIFYLLLAIGGVLWIGLRQGQIPLGLFFDPQAWWIDLLIGLACGGVLVAAWEAARRFLTGARRVEDLVAATLGEIDRSEALTLAVLSGVAEEFFFRGAMQAAWGVLPATILFTVLHLGPGKEYRLWTVFAALAGAMFGALALWRGTILAPTAAHILVNAIGLNRVAERGVTDERPLVD